MNSQYLGEFETGRNLSDQHKYFEKIVGNPFVDPPIPPDPVEFDRWKRWVTRDLVDMLDREGFTFLRVPL